MAWLTKTVKTYIRTFPFEPGTILLFKMAANWISVQGNTIVSDFDHPVVIEYHRNGAVIKPKGSATTGVFHACLPNSPNGSAKLEKLEIRHTHILSKTKEIEIYHDNNIMYKGLPSSPTSQVDISNVYLNIDGEPERFGWGVSVTVEFSGSSSVLFVSSLTMRFKK